MALLRTMSAGITLALIVCVHASASIHVGEQQPVNNQTTHIQSLTSAIQRAVEEPPPTRIHVMAVGDIMMHMPQITAAKTKDGYDFRPVFAPVAPIFAQADVVLGNLETTLAGERARYSGYPLFNAPDALADALADAHFDIITTANNHALDRGERGVLRTIEQLRRAGLKHTGTATSEAERNNPLVYDVRGIRVGVAAYTFGTNGIPIPKNKPWIINMIDEQSISTDIARLRSAGASVIVVALHAGDEYARHPNSIQRHIVRTLHELGVHIVVGSHPHVVQPIETLHTRRSDGTDFTTVVIYSMGNFVSNQRMPYTDVGCIFSVWVEQRSKRISLEDPTCIPTYVHRATENGRRAYLVIPTDRSLRPSRAFSDSLERTIAQKQDEVRAHVTPQVLPASSYDPIQNLDQIPGIK